MLSSIILILTLLSPQLLASPLKHVSPFQHQVSKRDGITSFPIDTLTLGNPFVPSQDPNIRLQPIAGPANPLPATSAAHIWCVLLLVSRTTFFNDYSKIYISFLRKEECRKSGGSYFKSHLGSTSQPQSG